METIFLSIHSENSFNNVRGCAPWNYEEKNKGMVLKVRY